MLKSDENIDNVFKQGLGSFEAVPSGKVWEGIESSLNEQAQKKRLVLFWQVSAAASIVLAALLSWLLMDNNADQLVEVAIVNSVSELKTDNNNAVGNAEVKGVKSILSEKTDDNSLYTNRLRNSARDVIEVNKSKAPVVINAMPAFDKASTEAKRSLFTLKGRNEIVLASNNQLNTTQLKRKSNREYYPLYVYEDEKKAKARMKMLLGGSMSTAYNYRESSGAPVQSASNYSESGINTLGGGLNIRFEGKSRWSIETGVLFAQLGQEVNANHAYQSDNMAFEEAFVKASVMPSKAFSNSMGNIKFDGNSGISPKGALNDIGMSMAESNYVSPSADGLRQTLDYIEVPVMARYKILDGFPILSLAGGLSSNFLVGNNAYLLEDGKRINVGETDNIKPLSWSSSVGLGLELPISKVFRFNIEPRVKYYLESVSANPNYDFQPYSFAVFGGITFIIK
jgi:hypothetical protein